MSTTSKLNPKSIAIKKKLHSRLGLTGKRARGSAQRAADEGRVNAEWATESSILPHAYLFSNLTDDVAFTNLPLMKKATGNEKLESKKKQLRFALAQKLQSENNRFSLNQLRHSLITQMHHSSLLMTAYHLRPTELPLFEDLKNQKLDIQKDLLRPLFVVQKKSVAPASPFKKSEEAI